MPEISFDDGDVSIVRGAAVVLISGWRLGRCRCGSAAGDLNEKPGLAHFLPARLEWRGGAPEVKALKWQGSGDIVALAKANCFLVVPADRDKIAAGERVSVLLRKDLV